MIITLKSNNIVSELKRSCIGRQRFVCVEVKWTHCPGSCVRNHVNQSRYYLLQLKKKFQQPYLIILNNFIT